MRNNDGWIEPAIHIILVVCVVLALLGIVTAAHFVIKYW